MTKFNNYLSSKELDKRTINFIEKQWKELFNEIQILKYQKSNKLNYA
jgi:hypothetical protein